MIQLRIFCAACWSPRNSNIDVVSDSRGKPQVAAPQQSAIISVVAQQQQQGDTNPAPFATPSSTRSGPARSIPSQSAVSRPDSMKKSTRRVNKQLRNLRILIVDDSISIMKMMRLTISNLGHIVDSASHGREALDLLQRGSLQYDLVLCDIQMPVMGGIEAVYIFREFEARCISEGSRSIKQIIIGMSASPDTRKGALEAGMDHFIAKPFSMDTLMQALVDLGFFERFGGESDIKSTSPPTIPSTADAAVQQKQKRYEETIDFNQNHAFSNGEKEEESGDYRITTSNIITSSPAVGCAIPRKEQVTSTVDGIVDVDEYGQFSLADDTDPKCDDVLPADLIASVLSKPAVPMTKSHSIAVMTSMIEPTAEAVPAKRGRKLFSSFSVVVDGQCQVPITSTGLGPTIRRNFASLSKLSEGGLSRERQLADAGGRQSNERPDGASGRSRLTKVSPLFHPASGQ